MVRLENRKIILANKCERCYCKSKNTVLILLEGGDTDVLIYRNWRVTVQNPWGSEQLHNHMVIFHKLNEFDESLDPETMNFTAFLEGYKFENGTATKLVKITRELNLINVLQNIYALGDTCSYVIDGDFLAPVAFVNSVCFKRK